MKNVDVHLAGEPSSLEALEAVLRERLGGEGVRARFDRLAAVDPATVVTPGATSDEQLARIWIDLRGDERFTVYIVDGAWERVLVRHLARRANPEVAFEEIGHIVELAVSALAAGERIGVVRDVARADLLEGESREGAPAFAPPPPRDVAAPPAREAGRRVTVGGGAYWGASAYSGSLELASGPGLVVDGRTPMVRRVELGGVVMGQLFLPSRAEARSATVRLTGFAVHALVEGTLALGARDALALGLGGGVQLERASAEGTPGAGVRFAEDVEVLVPSVRALVRYRHAWPWAGTFVGVGLDVPLRNTRYVLSRETDRQVLFEPWAARPFALAGITFP